MRKFGNIFFLFYCFTINIASTFAFAPSIAATSSDCDYFFGGTNEVGTVAYYLSKTFKFIKFVAPIAVIVLSMIDYIKVIASSDADLLKKTNTRTIKRLIFAMILFILPTIIEYLLELLGVQGTCTV